jgi:hypothetical protein
MRSQELEVVWEVAIKQCFRLSLANARGGGSKRHFFVIIVGTTLASLLTNHFTNQLTRKTSTKV